MNPFAWVVGAIATLIFLDIKKEREEEELEKAKQETVQLTGQVDGISRRRIIKEKLIKDYGSECQGCGKEFEHGDNLEIDHIDPKSKGGNEKYGNLQLLCSSCNRLKGDKSMDHLKAILEKREEERS